MAIKGKKKSKSSAAKRRPAAAPRPVVGARRKVPWYRTGKGLAIAGSVLAVIIVGVIALAMGGDSTDERQIRKLETYTSDMRAMLQRLYDPLGILVRSAGDPTNAKQGEVEDAEAALIAAQSDSAAISPAVGTETAHRVFQESLALYIEAAGLLKDAIVADNARPFSTRAATLIARGDALFQIATADLDTALQDAELDPSGFGFPSAGAAVAQPTTQPTVAPTERPKQRDKKKDD